MADRLDTQVAGYRIESLISRGGMGEVYLAEQDAPRRKVALKLLSPELSLDAGFREASPASPRPRPRSTTPT